MENTPYLYDTLVQVLRQHRNWLDLRHRKTLAWMMVGLIHTGSISLGAWTPYVVSRAWVESKHGTPVSALARQRQDRRARPLWSAHAHRPSSAGSTRPSMWP